MNAGKPERGSAREGLDVANAMKIVAEMGPDPHRSKLYYILSES